MGARDLSEEGRPVSVGVVFDRFPASVRGAVVVRGADRNPHQVRLLRVVVVDHADPAREVHVVPMDDTDVNIPPHGEVVIPFDIPFSSLEPGAYSVAAEVLIDGATRASGPEDGFKRFTVPR